MWDRFAAEDAAKEEAKRQTNIRNMLIQEHMDEGMEMGLWLLWDW